MDDLMIESESMDCVSELSLDADTEITVEFSKEATAILFLASCDDVSSSHATLYDHNYVIVDLEWDSWGTNEVLRFCDVLDGIPGISFGSKGLPQVGDQLSPFKGRESLFAGDNRDNRYETGELTITIEQSGSSLGEFIGGSVEGMIYNQNNELDSALMTGRFCAPIIYICN